MKESIQLKNVTKDYGSNKGVFDLNLTIQEGEVFGIVGINGSGKTTILRQMMGFIKPTNGTIMIQGKDAWKKAAKLKNSIGYVPGEIAFPEAKTGNVFLKSQAGLLRLEETKQTNELIQALKLDTKANLKRMSKGMKQKTAIVDAFMADPEILLLDEPTTGLDPVMRDVFINLILDSKKRGKTIVMSSHMFNELEPTCDRIAFLQNGRIVEIIDKKKIDSIKAMSKVELAFQSRAGYENFLKEPLNVLKRADEKSMISIGLKEGEISEFIRRIDKYDLKNISFSERGLEEYFEEKLHLEVI